MAKGTVIQMAASTKGKPGPSTETANEQRHKVSRPAWLIAETCADGTRCWMVRLPFSEHAIGEPGYFGPFLQEATARAFETEAYNLVLDAVTACSDKANELHEREIIQPDGEPAWMGGAR